MAKDELVEHIKGSGVSERDARTLAKVARGMGVDTPAKYEQLNRDIDREHREGKYR